MAKVNLSIIIPCYNEGSTFTKSVDKIVQELKNINDCKYWGFKEIFNLWNYKNLSVKELVLPKFYKIFEYRIVLFLISLTFPFFGFFITLFILPTKKIIQSRDEFNLAKELFKYNIPVAIFTIIAAVSARLDTYLTAVLLSTKDIGIYGAANQLVQVMPQLVSALGLVAAPKFSSFQNNSQMLTYFRKFQLFVLGLCILGILTIPISIYLIPVLFGQAYQEAVTPFIFLFIAMLVFLFSIPVHNSVIFYFSRPDVFIWVAIGHLAIIGGLGYIMISNYGVVGASITVLVGTIFNFLYPLIWMVIKLKR